jgi:uncharacterized phage-associated protein
MTTVSVFDVAAFILQELEEITCMKLQKLVYYCQAWSLVWDEEPLFKESIEAWINGPVVRELYEAHRGKFKLQRGDISGNPKLLTTPQRDTIKAVLRDYGRHSSQWLSDLTHSEMPWCEARVGLRYDERGNHTISLESLVEYYGMLYSEGVDLSQGND